MATAVAAGIVMVKLKKLIRLPDGQTIISVSGGTPTLLAHWLSPAAGPALARRAPGGWDVGNLGRYAAHEGNQYLRRCVHRTTRANKRCIPSNSSNSATHLGSRFFENSVGGPYLWVRAGHIVIAAVTILSGRACLVARVRLLKRLPRYDVTSSAFSVIWII